MQSVRMAQSFALIAIACFVQGEVSFADAAEAVVSFDTSVEGEIPIKIGDQQIAVYVYHDDEISRPYFAHLRAPGAPQVSRTHPPVAGKDRADHGTFHPGLWMSFGDISGNDYWRLAARVKHVRSAESPSGGLGRGSFTVANHYLSQTDKAEVVCQGKLQVHSAGEASRIPAALGHNFFLGSPILLW